MLLGASALGSLERASREADARPPAGGRLLGWAVVGIPLLSACWLALSALQLLRPVPVLITAAALTAGGAALAGRRVGDAVRELLATARDRACPPRSESPGDRDGLAPALAVLGASVVIAGLLALVPSVHYDDLVYHLGLPRQALITGSWPALPSFHHSFFPAGWEACFVLPLALGGDSGPQLMNATCLGLLAAATFRLARLGGGPAAAAVAAALALAAPVFVRSGALAGNDLFVALAIVVAAERAVATRGTRPLTTGLVAGAAWAAKYTALPALAGIALAHAWPSGEATWSRRARAVAVAGLASLLLAAPWTLRSAAATGNPVYPAFHDIFESESWSDTASDLLVRDSSSGSVATRGLVALPLSLVELATRSDELGMPGGLNAVHLALGALGALLLARRVTGWRTLLLTGCLAWLGWAMTSLFVRFAMAFVLLLVPFSARALHVLLAHPALGRWRRWLVVVLLIVGAAPQLARTPALHADLLGGQRSWSELSRAEILPRLVAVAAAGRSLASTPDDSVVLLVAEARLAPIPRRALASTALDEPLVGTLLDGAASPDVVSERARSLGVTHVLLNRREAERWSSRYAFAERLPDGGVTLLEEWLATLEPVGRWGPVLAWRLPPPRAVAAP